MAGVVRAECRDGGRDLMEGGGCGVGGYWVEGWMGGWTNESGDAASFYTKQMAACWFCSLLDIHVAHGEKTSV